jgi:tetratricopeptide (TPR) repeat protein
MKIVDTGAFMLAKSMRHAAAGVALLASATIAHAQAPATNAVYRGAVGTYVKTGNAAIAVKPLLGWDRKALDLAVADTIATGDAGLIEAAAALHLEIGVAIAGISTPSSAGHFDLGSQLVDSLVPVNPDVRNNLSAERAAEIAKIRTTWFGVAGSAFLSVNDVIRARPFFARALKISPKSPAILTLLGTADEIDGAVQNPDDVESLTLKTRVARTRSGLLFEAERSYRQALAADPGYALAQIRLGRLQFLFKNLKQAREWLEKGSAGATDPAHRYLAAMFTGALLQEQQDLAGARAAFERALEVAPHSQNAIVGLAYVELMGGRPDRAQTLARGFLGTPNSDDSWWAFKNGTLDQGGLQWLRGRVRK